MDFSKMNIDEIIKYFCEKYDNGEKISLKELRDAADNSRVMDLV